MAKKEGLTHMVCPAGCALEASVVRDLTVLPVTNFREVIEYFTGRISLKPVQVDPAEALAKSSTYSVDFSEVRGQQHVKRALEVAAAGGHNLLMVGPPGSGKTMLARRLPTILPPLQFEEAIETTKVYSILGLVRAGAALIGARPFRAPHHTVSDAGLVGGGTVRGRAKSRWRTTGYCFWTSCLSSAATSWRCCANHWRIMSSPLPEPE